MKYLLKRTGLFLQVRLSSSRLPGKALMNLCGKSILFHVLERMNVVPADVRVILTNKDCRDIFKETALRMGWEIFEGDDQNVLKRFVDAAKYYNVDIIIRATADNPLLSSEIALETIDLFNKDKCDLAYLAPIPYGSGVEVINSEILIDSLTKTNTPYDFEHVTPYIYQNNTQYKIKSENFHDIEIAREDVRLTIDTIDDFEKMNHLFRNLYKDGWNTKIKTIINLFDELKFDAKYKRILFITRYGENYGMGHIKRSLLLADKLNKNFNIYFSLGDDKNFPLNISIKNEYKIILNNELEEFINKEGIFERIIVDKRDTDILEMDFYKKLGPVISIDDVGQGGQRSDFIIQTLPYLQNFKKNKYNYDGIEYLLLKKAKIKDKNEINNPPKNVLITFGGSDPKKLSNKMASLFSQLGYSVTLIVGPFFNDEIKAIENCNIVKDIDDLSSYIEKSDLVVTSFGLTFFESLILKTPILLINPTIYHDKLTEEFGYPYYLKPEKGKEELDEIKKNLNNILNVMINENVFISDLSNNPLFKYFSLRIGNKTGEIIDFINDWSYSSAVCPNCSLKNDNIYYRAKKWNMFKCKKCKLTHIKSFINLPDRGGYDKEYFFSEYKKKYGKTYEDDKDNIIELAKSRLKIINKYIEKGNLLDYGSGLGFFAEYAEKNGFKTTSIDCSKYAVDYINNKLNLKAVQSNNNDYLEKTDHLFDVITSFFVIEHIKDFKKLLFLFKCHLKKNGVIVLSTPNSNGVSMRFNLSNYAKNHPEDHHVVFSPKVLKRILKDFGFGKFKIIIKGIHIDRFIKSKKISSNKLIIKVVCFLAKIFKLGDTFEIYAQRLQ